eukprot:6480758-Amphidinium_carterae.1
MVTFAHRQFCTLNSKSVFVGQRLCYLLGLKALVRACHKQLWSKGKTSLCCICFVFQQRRAVNCRLATRSNTVTGRHMALYLSDTSARTVSAPIPNSTNLHGSHVGGVWQRRAVWHRLLCHSAKAVHDVFFAGGLPVVYYSVMAVFGDVPLLVVGGGRGPSCRV